ncbi:MAG: hypothetical protein ACOCP8_03250 [archaeon]
MNKKFVKNIKEFKLEKNHVFSGYYDINPLNNNKLLAHKKNKDEYTEIGYFDLDNKKFHKIDKTTLSSWQFGSRLQWLDNNNIIYNKKDKKSFCIIHNIETKKTKKISFPIFQIDKKSKNATSLNFKHLYKFEKGYGYNNYKDGRDPNLYLINLKNDENKKILDLNDLIVKINDKTLNKNNSYFILPFFNPDGNKIAFLFKWKTKNNTFAKLCVCNLKGSDLKIINEEGYVAHFNWVNDYEIIYVLKHKNKTNYFIFNTKDHEIKTLPLFNEDGHPSILKEYIVSDTYPSIFSRKQKLLFCDIKERNLSTLYFSIANYNHINEKKCDFHPKISSNKICIDDGSKFYRKIILLEI